MTVKQMHTHLKRTQVVGSHLQTVRGAFRGGYVRCPFHRGPKNERTFQRAERRYNAWDANNPNSSHYLWEPSYSRGGPA